MVHFHNNVYRSKSLASRLAGLATHRWGRQCSTDFPPSTSTLHTHRRTALWLIWVCWALTVTWRLVAARLCLCVCFFFSFPPELAKGAMPPVFKWYTASKEKAWGGNMMHSCLATDPPHACTLYITAHTLFLADSSTPLEPWTVTETLENSPYISIFLSLFLVLDEFWCTRTA